MEHCSEDGVGKKWWGILLPTIAAVLSRFYDGDDETKAALKSSLSEAEDLAHHSDAELRAAAEAFKLALDESDDGKFELEVSRPTYPTGHPTLSCRPPTGRHPAY